MTENSSAATCLVCGAALSENVIECSKCGTPHHLSCWEYTNRCAVFGCGCEVGRTRSQAPTEPEAPLVMRTASSASTASQIETGDSPWAMPKFNATDPSLRVPRRSAGPWIVIAFAVILGVGVAATVVMTAGGESPTRTASHAGSATLLPDREPLREALRRGESAIDGARRQVDDAKNAAATAIDPSLRAQIKARFSQIRACYERALKGARPGLEGNYLVQFRIAESGSVTSAKITSDSVREPSLAACVVAKIRSWRFSVAPGTGPTTISYPIIFRASTH
ncbi:MAG: TonB family protein [Deltaproteobacteria bacterium]|nr:TonB family protein [Deltaproteobacteria bacterium]